MTMSLHDGAINAGREAEIVSVDDEAPHAAIVARCGCCGCCGCGRLRLKV